MKVLAISHTGLFSGAERVLVDALDAARQRGWGVTCATPPGTLAEALTARQVPLVTLPEMKLPSGPRPLGMARLATRWARGAGPLQRAAVGADVVVVNGALALPALRAARPPAPAVWLVHDVIARRDLRLVVRASASALSGAVAVSEAAAALPRRLGLPVTVAHNGTRWPVDPAPLHHPDPPVIGLCAALTDWKGQHIALEALTHLPGDVTLELLGGHFPKDGPYVERLAARAQQPDLAGRVRFLGRREDPLAVMARWRVAINASVAPEACPLAVLEAMSLGLPIVATGHGGTVELVGQAGLLVPPGDPAALAGALTELLADDGLRQRCALAGRAAVAERFSHTTAMSRLLDAFATAAAKPGDRI